MCVKTARKRGSESPAFFSKGNHVFIMSVETAFKT